MLLWPHGLAEKFLQQGDLANQDSFLYTNINPLPSADVDAFGSAFRFALLLGLQDTSLFVTLSF